MSKILRPDQAGQLYGLIHIRRAAAPARSLAASMPTPGRSYIQRSPEQRSPDRRASLLRRRQHAATGPLPPNLAANFTMGELAALKIVSDEFLARGACDISRNEIGARAGVSQSVVKRALRLAARLTMISVLHRPRSGRKHLTNIIRIIRAEWLAWLDRGNRKAMRSRLVNAPSQTSNGLEGSNWTRHGHKVSKKPTATVLIGSRIRGIGRRLVGAGL